MKEVIEKKIKYYEKRQQEAMTRFLNSCKRVDRDSLLKLNTRIETYKELLQEKV